MTVTRKRVVITGMGHLSSIATNVPEFKQALFDKTCGIKPSKKYLEWFEDANASEVLQPLSWPGLSDEMVASLDNAALWAYKVGHEALEQGKLPAGALRDRTALIIGVSSAGTEAFIPLIEQRMEAFSLQKAIISGSFASCSAIVSSLLGLKGGFELVATACTASTNAMGIGYDLIQNGKNSTALVVGTEPIYLPTFAGFYALHAMKRTPSSPFSGSPGMSIGEGAGALLLEEYEHAVARGATIYGEMVSYATSCDAYHETAPDPRGEGAVQVMRHALQNAALTPEDIGYINAHGTGTEANDRCETLAMKKVFPNIMDIPVSSTKAYVGHNIGSAGIIELIACFLTLPENKILPTLNFTTPRPNCDLNYVPNEFQDGDVRLFMKNNYAFGGNNCCVIASVKPEQSPASVYAAKRVAITGMGAVSAAGHTLQAMLQRMWHQQTPDGLTQLQLDESTREEFRQMLGAVNKNSESRAFLNQRFAGMDIDSELDKATGVHQITDLDPRKTLRRFDPRKANLISTFALLALTQAMNDAGRKIKRDGQTLGMILGMSKGPQATVDRYLQSLFPDPTKVRTSEFPGSLMNAISTFCSISEGIKGYNTSLATGINAGLGALTYGYELVRQALQPQVIVGGADENMSTFAVYLQALSGDLQLTCDPAAFQVYSNHAQGYIPGEGAAMLLLEDLHHAQARGAHIHAEIIGYGKDNDGSFFEPHDVVARSASLSRAIGQALQEAGLEPHQLDLVCGTSDGTPLRNAVEIDALRRSLGEARRRVPLVNYNGWFGLVESSIGLLNIAVVSEIMQRGEILPIPYTQEFCAEDFHFVTAPLQQAVNTALVIGATEGGNHYAVVLRKTA
ncbi:beta-ketoacyl-[acyl-carrier-protein] synthase family protein [Serratia rubidaea]|uniref:3-oxoacyl-[acyl-carrier-protein] synthase 2 n=1 Tax=Serratia rubidaea TaxID=61652 RepID=A0A447QUN7_SERRU|nr:beta-ketoacyl-[acyl-carrier-protein] synthase family protein [Serratia rubidaea]MBD8454985.1 beta-ketoacyl-ACP synthase [Serratia rubidaea]MCR0998210.1 beta-ketoacyl-[acyl-carrier-protein] synthase family protein [Serratia rubidaea]MDC6110877.1 beta-ketoacyl-[acyl-carrier-protein] synthase family protein [Serratia rubidaea]VEA73671.1 3-oxoacyl-[acyl-carrier-protein] synthase 2 [Serratia rubidaea]